MFSNSVFDSVLASNCVSRAKLCLSKCLDVASVSDISSMKSVLMLLGFGNSIDIADIEPMATCLVDNCRKQYCGSSTQFMHVRHSGHRQEILSLSTSVGRHFATCGLENMQIQMIDSVKEGELVKFGGILAEHSSNFCGKLEHQHKG